MLLGDGKPSDATGTSFALVEWTRFFGEVRLAALAAGRVTCVLCAQHRVMRIGLRLCGRASVAQADPLGDVR